MTAAPVSPRKRRLFTALAALLACLIAGIAWEVALRVQYSRWRSVYDNQGWFGRLTRASDDRELVWEYCPNGSTTDEWGPIRTNSFGFRERTFEVAAKPAGQTRIAVIGDSVTLGMFVPEDKTFVRRLEALLHVELGRPDVEVLNFSVDGYDALQVRAMLRDKALAFEPDLVVYALCLNDFDRDMSSGEKSQYFCPPPVFVWKALQDALAKLRVHEDGYHRFIYEQRRRPVFDAIRDMRRLVEAAGGRFEVALLPLFPIPATLPAFTTEPKGTLRDYPAAWTAIQRGISEFLVAEGVPVLDSTQSSPQ